MIWLVSLHGLLKREPQLKVPVGIYNGACEIDFAPLHKQLWGDEETVP